MNPLLVTVLVGLTMVVTDVAFGQQNALQPHAVSSRLHRIVVKTPADLRELFSYQGSLLPILSAHRGGAGAGLPENCIATFEQTLRHTYSMLEVDPRMTRDGEIVVHHDATLDRTTNGTGLLIEKSLAELKQLRLKDIRGEVTDYQIPTLDEVIQWARGKTILVLDQKDVPLALRIAKIQQHQAHAYCMLIVGNLKDAKACYAADPNVMMEAMITDEDKMKAFDASGIPWNNVIAFLGHEAPQSKELYDAVHARGARCMVGTSRNLDQAWVKQGSTADEMYQKQYQHLRTLGADVIETDIPRELSKWLPTRDSDLPKTFFAVQ